MGSFIKKYFFLLIESYIAVTSVAILAAFIWPDFLRQLNGWATPLLQIIFFLSSLKMDLGLIRKSFVDYRPLLTVNLYMLIFLPIIAFVISYFFMPSMMVPLVLLAAMPTAMSTPLFVQIVKGDVPYSLVLTVTTSLLAPFTIPLVIKILLGSVIHIDMFQMMLKLMYVIFIPFILAQVYKNTLNKKLSLTQFSFKGVSIVMLGLLITGIIANNVGQLRQVKFSLLLYYFAVMVGFYVIMHILGYYLTFWKNNVDKMTTAIATTYMNFVLSLYIAGKYFNTVDVVIPLIISILPWTLLLIPYQKVLQKLHQIK